MNYIKRLEKENKELRATMAVGEQKLTELATYLDSKKFRCGDPLDGYVNIADIHTPLIEARLLLRATA